ncbi:HU family DNA-binding protein [bacterium]|nr:HU family DNA-binding protein [bacterium]
MTNREMLAAISARTALSEAEAREVLSVILDTIKDAVWDGDKVMLTNFGTFYLAERKARTYKNPKPHMPAVRPARKYPKFVPAPNFEELVR